MALILPYSTVFCILSSFYLLPLTLGLGGHITPQEHKQVAEYLTTEIKKANDDKFSDTVTQVSKDKYLIYHKGDAEQPVFFSHELPAKGKPVVVLKRGEDYITPEDQMTFIVLKQKGGSEYAVHIAYVYNVGRRSTPENKIIAWQNGRIEQQPNVTTVLNLIGNKYLPRPSPFDKRPRCEWVASVLLCNAKKAVTSKSRTFPPKLATITPDPDKDSGGGGSGSGDEGKSGSGDEGNSGSGDEGKSGSGDGEKSGSGESAGGGGSESGGGNGDRGKGGDEDEGNSGDENGSGGKDDREDVGGEEGKDGADMIGSEGKGGGGEEEIPDGSNENSSDPDQPPTWNSKEKSDSKADINKTQTGGLDNSQERYVTVKLGNNTEKGKKNKSKRYSKSGDSLTINKQSSTPLK